MAGKSMAKKSPKQKNFIAEESPFSAEQNAMVICLLEQL